jgi:aspartokinase-like uncharacterized kinase
MWIVKLGGSLLGSPELASWLALIAKFGDGKVIIVPGGGLFADAVREAQKISNISDAVAHELALLAMDQFGLLLAGMNPELVTASSELEIAERGWQHRGIIWLPSRMVLADDSIPKNWEVTSDSLSAWLANKLSAEQLILVKSKSLTAYKSEAQSSLQHLVEDELIDSQFIRFIQQKNSIKQKLPSEDFKAWVLNKADYNIFEHGFSYEKIAGHGLRIHG